jgi:hypothetical protein
LIAGEPQPNKQQRQGSAFAVLAVALGAGLLLILLATLRDSGRRTWWGCHPMSRTDNLYELPKNLPVPLNDGACDHLAGLQLPSVELLSTARRKVDLSTLSGKTVVYCYPRTGRPDQEIPKGWNEIPGARGARRSPVPSEIITSSSRHSGYGCLVLARRKRTTSERQPSGCNCRLNCSATQSLPSPVP